MNMRIYGFKYKTVRSIDRKLSALSSNKLPSYYYQPSDVLIKWPLLKSPGKYSHASQFIKNLYYITLKGNTLLQIKKWWDSVLYSFFQYLSTKNIWTTKKSLKSQHHNISYFLLPPPTNTKLSTANKNYEELSRALRVHSIKCETITSSKHQNHMPNSLHT